LRNLIILTLPRNIPGTIQVIGRAVREGSFKQLHQKDRYVNLYIIASPLYEVTDYTNAMLDYTRVL
jgi:ubiquinone/menaquinone biosynthesis C-methylase UbiE